MSDALQIGDALDDVRLDSIARLSGIAAPYWNSIELAADRGEAHLVVLHCKQVAEVTRETFAIVKALGSQEADL